MKEEYKSFVKWLIRQERRKILTDLMRMNDGRLPEMVLQYKPKRRCSDEGCTGGRRGGDILCCNPRSFVGEPLGTHWAVYWVVSRAGLNTVLKRRTSICEANQTWISRPSGSEPTYFTDCARRSTNVENSSVTLPSHFVHVLWDREDKDLRNRVGTMRDSWEGVGLCSAHGICENNSWNTGDDYFFVTNNGSE